MNLTLLLMMSILHLPQHGRDSIPTIIDLLGRQWFVIFRLQPDRIQSDRFTAVLQA